MRIHAWCNFPYGQNKASNQRQAQNTQLPVLNGYIIYIPLHDRTQEVLGPARPVSSFLMTTARLPVHYLEGALPVSDKYTWKSIFKQKAFVLVRSFWDVSPGLAWLEGRLNITVDAHFTATRE